MRSDSKIRNPEMIRNDSFIFETFQFTLSNSVINNSTLISNDFKFFGRYKNWWVKAKYEYPSGLSSQTAEILCGRIAFLDRILEVVGPRAYKGMTIFTSDPGCLFYPGSIVFLTLVWA